MNRISGLEKSQAPWHLRWFYTTMRKMFGKDLTPVKQQMRVPGMVWGSIAMEAGLGAEAEGFVAVYSTWEGADSVARRLSVLSRHQFCRWQKSWFD